MYQCYFKNKEGIQCTNNSEDCWCSLEHRTLWQQQNYAGVTKMGKKKLSIKEMQKRLLEMGAKEGGTKQLPIDSGGSKILQPDA